MKLSQTKVELLAPAGKWEVLVAVIEAGADAVYIAGKRFNMRMHRSDFNFTDEQLALAVEYARHGVTAHTILPGWIETAMTEDSFKWDTFVERVLPRVPARRWGQPEDFAAIAVYIMSAGSSYHTSENFLIDGGYSVF